MSTDDIDRVVLELHNFLIEDFGILLNEDTDYGDLHNFMHVLLEKFVTRDRNYN